MVENALHNLDVSKNSTRRVSPAGAKLTQKNSLARGLRKNDDAALSIDAPEPALCCSMSSYSRRSGRWRSISASWNSRRSSGDSTLPCPTSRARTSRHNSTTDCAPDNLAEKEFGQQVNAEGLLISESGESAAQMTLQSVESAGQTETQVKVSTVESAGQQIPQTVKSEGQTETTIHLPLTVRDVAVHSALENSQVQDALEKCSHTEEGCCSTTSPPSKSRHLQWQVAQQHLPRMTAIASPEMCKDLAPETMINVQSDIIDYDPTETKDSATTLTESAGEEDKEEAEVVDIEQEFAQPVNKFITGGPLHALASLTLLDFSPVGRPGTPAGDLQQLVEQTHPENSRVSHAENAISCKQGSFSQETTTSSRLAFPAISSEYSSSRSSEGQCVLMRANMVYEPAVKGTPTVTLRKKIKMKAPTPKQTFKTKKFPLPANDAKSDTRLQTGNQDRVQSQTKEECPDNQLIISEAGDLESKRVKQNVTKDIQDPGTCVVTHGDHSIEISELQDPPTRRRWPKVSASFVSVANRNNTEMSSASSSCESLQDERKKNGEVRLYLINPRGSSETAAAQSKDVVGGQSSNASSNNVIGIFSQCGKVSTEEQSNSEQLKERSDMIDQEQDLSSKDAAVFKTGVRVSLPSASVREISFDSASMIHQRSFPNSHQCKGEEDEMEKLGIELQSHWEITSSLPANYLPCTAQSLSSGLSDEETKDSTKLQESTSYPPHITPSDRGNGSPGEPNNPGDVPQQTSNNPSNESLFTTIVNSKNSKNQALDASASALAPSSRRHTNEKATPENMKFGRGVWIAAPHQEINPERASLSSEKLCNILAYLGHVEESNLQENYTILQKCKPACDSPTSARSPRTVLEHDDSVSLADSTFTTTLTNVSHRSATDSIANSGDGDGSRNPAVSLFEGVRKKIQHYKDRINSQESQNAQLLRELERVKAEREQALSLEREKFGRELEIRAAEYKAAIQHHLSLNEKMVKDKETLSEKYCNLAGVLSTAESKFEEKLKVSQAQAAQDLKKQKELWIAGEKPRREAWKDMKLKEIKEITIKGLEPHIEGIVEKHKQEMQKLETRYADDTQKKLELQAIQHRQEMCELRDRLLKDQDDRLEKERMTTLQRMNEVAEKYQQQAMQLRMRVSGDMAAELERVEESRRKDKHDAHELLSKFQKEAADRENTLRKGLEKAMQDAISYREDEINQMQAQIVKQKSEWQNALDEKLHEEMQTKEKELQARCMKERDEQIEMIIERMEMEKDEAIDKKQQGLLVKVERLMEEKLDFMKRMKDVESKCAGLCQLSLEAKQKAETELENRDVQVESLERALSCQSESIEQLKAQINQEKSNLKQQEERFESRIKQEQKLLQSALLDVERSNADAQQMRARKVEELAEVEAHVRQAIDNKDLVIVGLREQLMSAREQIRHTELLLS